MSDQKKDERWLITRVHVVVGDGEDLDDVDVLIAGGRIEQVSAKRLVDDGAVVIDGFGKTLIPGLVDAHVHLHFLRARCTLHARLLARFRIRRSLKELVQHGITSIRCMGDPPAIALRLRDRLNAGPSTAPRMVVAGPVLTAPGGHPACTVAADNRWLRKRLAVELDDPDASRAAVRRLHAAGVDVIKVVYQGGRYGEEGVRLGKLSPQVMAAIVDEAHRLGLPVSAHTHHQDDVDELLAAGVDLFEHGILEEDVRETGTLERWAAGGAWLVPTLYIATLVHDWAGRTYHAPASRNLRRAHEAGVRIAAGTDAMIGALPPTALHEELRLMTAAGIPSADVLRMATRDAASSLGLNDRGTIHPGQVADVVLLHSDPVEQIENVADVAMVFRDGQLVHRVERPPRPELPRFIPPTPGRLSYADETTSTVTVPATVTYDITRFSRDGVREITYTASDSDTLLRRETIISTPELVTTEWACSIPEKDTDLVATHIGPNVVLTGRFEGEPVSRTYPLRGRTWLQAFSFDAATFVASSMDSMAFVAIGTNGRGALAMTDFEITKTGRQPADDDDRSRVTTRLVMPEWRRFWASLGQYDGGTGVLLRQHTRGKKTERLRLRRDHSASEQLSTGSAPRTDKRATQPTAGEEGTR